MTRKIYLVRHAQSRANVDHTFLHTETNVGIHLTDVGHQQALDTAQFLADNVIPNTQAIKVWNSPYQRTRLTSQAIKEEFSKKSIQYTEEESIYIAERQLGILDDAKNYSASHPIEYNHYILHKQQSHDYFVRPPLGESPFDMCMRLDFFLRTVLATDSHETHIIVTHGAALRGLIMMHQKWSYEQYSAMKNPFNASVHLLLQDNEINEYKGEIFKPSKVTG